MNTLLKISYDGKNYNGWQSQPNGTTIQDTIAFAVEKIFGKFIRPVSVSRTDSGVHALMQYAQLRLPKEFDINKLPLAINTHLPSDIRILSAKKVSDDFQIHKIAKTKTYSYFILEGDPRPFHEGYVLGIRGKLDLSAIKKASKLMTGKHDFKSFQGQKCSRKENTICNISSIKTVKCRNWLGMNGKLYRIDFEGDSFLKHMVRNMTGLLVEVGLGIKKHGEVKTIMKARDRKKSGRCAPSDGLYLMKISLNIRN